MQKRSGIQIQVSLNPKFCFFPLLSTGAQNGLSKIKHDKSIHLIELIYKKYNYDPHSSFIL